MADSDSSFISKSRARSKAKRVLARSQYDQSIASNLSSATSECSFSTSKSLRKDKYMTKDAISFESETEKGTGNSSYKNPCTTVRKIARITLLAIMHLGLRFCEDDIQLSDMLRWIREGHLSYYSVTHFLPSKMVLRGKDGNTFGPCRYFPTDITVRKTAGCLAVTLGIDSLPVPNFSRLIQRYVKDMELPEELAKFAIKLWTEYFPQMPLNNSQESYDDAVPKEKNSTYRKQKILPNYEGRAMAILLYAMKLLFGLDGSTELNLSDFASKANKILGLRDSPSSQEANTPNCRFFVWKEWVNYIEFRSALIRRFHFPSLPTHGPEFVHLFRCKSDLIPPNPPSQEFHGYLKYLKCLEEKSNHRKPDKKDPEWVHFMKKELEEIFENHTESTSGLGCPSFQPSITPQYSYFKEMRDNIALQKMWSSQVGGGPCEQLLHSIFSSTSLSYLLNPNECIEALKKKEVTVTVVKGSALSKNDVKFVQPVWRVSPKNLTLDVELADDGELRKEKFHWFEKIDKVQILRSGQKKQSELTKKRRESLSLHATKTTHGSRIRTVKSELSKRKKGHSGKTKLRENSMAGIKNKCLTLFLPYRKLWMFYGNFSHLNERTFYHLSQRFPNSFIWILHLCAKMIETSDDILYSELVNVELMYKLKKADLFHDAARKEVNKIGHTYEQFRTSLAKWNW